MHGDGGDARSAAVPPGHVATAARHGLRRIQGQLGGIVTMIEEGRACRDVIQQWGGGQG
ncbi:MAG: metal-sensing transcriptional repressor, partial [Actinomycetota bacterium]|nr:metal-sensing transcriptional repressor [Actinomycetota bacterium]